jgi:hypothetical protein
MTTIASRALAIYFLAWMLSEITYVPALAYSFFHDVGRAGAFNTYAYYSNHDAISLSFHAARICALFLVAQCLYRGGPAVHRFLLGSLGVEDSSSE